MIIKERIIDGIKFENNDYRWSPNIDTYVRTYYGSRLVSSLGATQYLHSDNSDSRACEEDE